MQPHVSRKGERKATYLRKLPELSNMIADVFNLPVICRRMFHSYINEEIQPNMRIAVLYKTTSYRAAIFGYFVVLLKISCISARCVAVNVNMSSCPTGISTLPSSEIFASRIAFK